MSERGRGDAGSTVALEHVHETGWRRGLANMMRAEFAGWWRTKTWWVQSLIWTAITCGPLATIIFSDPEAGMEGPVLYSLFTMFGAIAIAIVMMEAVAQDRRQGTAEWVLSKPVSREAWVVAKFVPNAIGSIATIALIPGVVAFALFSVSGNAIEPVRFLGGLGVISLNLFFYVALALLIGVLTDRGGAVIGGTLGVAFGQQILTGVEAISGYLPWSLVGPTGSAEASVASAVMTGSTVGTSGALWSVSIATVIFIAVALWRFKRVEL